MTGDQVVNTAIGGFGVHVGQVALQMPLMWSQSLKLAVVVLPGWTMVPLASQLYCSICAIMEQQPPVAEEPSMQPVMCKLEPWNYNIT